jgi:hypothetical protein
LEAEEEFATFSDNVTMLTVVDNELLLLFFLYTPCRVSRVNESVGGASAAGMTRTSLFSRHSILMLQTVPHGSMSMNMNKTH